MLSWNVQGLGGALCRRFKARIRRELHKFQVGSWNYIYGLNINHIKISAHAPMTNMWQLLDKLCSETLMRNRNIWGINVQKTINNITNFKEEIMSISLCHLEMKNKLHPFIIKNHT